MKHTRFAAASVSALVLSAALLGCTPEAGDSPLVKPEKSTAPVTVEEPVQTPEPKELVEPEAPADTALPLRCDEILPDAELAMIHESLISLTQGDAEPRLEGLLGPKSWAALSGSDSVLMCSWGIPQTDAIAAVGVGIIDSSTKSDLIAALQDSVYVEQPFEGAEIAFVQGQSSERQWVDEIALKGDVLITTVHTVSGDFTARALQRVIALNPELGLE